MIVAVVSGEIVEGAEEILVVSGLAFAASVAVAVAIAMGAAACASGLSA